MGDSPRMIRRLSSLVAALALAAVAAMPATPALAVGGQTYVDLTNVKRASVKLGPVGFSSALDKISVERANQMASKDVLAHDMTYVSNRLKQLGVCVAGGIGEIIAWEKGYPTYDYQRTIDQWWASAGHHAIMVGDYNAAAGSHANSASGATYSVMIFAKLCQAPSTASSQISRLAGDDRYETAAAISRARYAPGVAVAYVATGQNFPDALAGAPAAARANAPILLVTRDSVPAVTATELQRLKPGRIVVLGSSGAVGSGVARTLDGLTAGSVSRLAGSDRYATAATISRATFGAGVAVVYIATGENFPDALGGGAAAGYQKGPVLLTRATGLPSVTATELSRLRPGRIVILGASGVVSSHVADQLRHYSSNVSRLAGDDRYATAVSVSRSTYGSAGAGTVFVATGTKFPDGLAGGPTAAIAPGPLLLVQPNALPSEVATELRRLDPNKVIVLGSSGVVSDAVVRAIDAALP